MFHSNVRRRRITNSNDGLYVCLFERAKNYTRTCAVVRICMQALTASSPSLVLKKSQTLKEADAFCRRPSGIRERESSGS